MLNNAVDHFLDHLVSSRSLSQSHNLAPAALILKLTIRSDVFLKSGFSLLITHLQLLVFLDQQTIVKKNEKTVHGEIR